MSRFILTIEASTSTIAGLAPLLDIRIGGATVSAASITQQTGLGTNIFSFTLDYAGSFPSSLQFRFNGGSGDGDETVTLHNVRINGQALDMAGDLTATMLTIGQTATVNAIASLDYLFGRVEPTAGDLGTVTDSGTGAADTIIVGSGNQVVDAGVGNDRVEARDGDDAINGDAGDDMLYGQGGNDLIIGGAGNDKIWGNDGDDLLYGQGDNDNLFGEAGNDVLNGGDGNDVLNGGAGNDILYGEAGDDRMMGVSGSNSFYGDTGNDVIIGGRDNDTAFGGDDDDTIHGALGDDTLNGENGNDYITGGDGADTVTGGSGADRIFGGAGIDSLSGGTEDDRIFGEAGDDVINGDANNDTLVGGDGADTISGGDGDDFIHGGGLDAREISSILQANPSIIFSEATNSFYQFVNSSVLWTTASANAQAATLMGVGGHLTTITSLVENDIVYQLGVANGASSSTGVGGNRIWLAASDIAVDQEWFWMEGPEAGLQLSQASTATNNLFTRWGSGQPNNAGGPQPYATIWFNAGNLDTWDDRQAADTHDYVIEWDAGSLSDDNAADILNGGNGNDYIYGWGGDDTLNGDAGIDILFGGDGADTLNGGNDSDTLAGGNGGDTLDGGAANDFMYGQEGDDTLEGGAGDDLMDGGNGIDTADYFGLGAGVTVNLALATAQNTVSGGIDTLRNIENLNGTAFADTLTGDGGVNVITGNAGADIIAGGAGDDTLNGGDGDDDISGGAGADTMSGGNNNDDFFVSGTDSLGDVFDGGAGTDRVYLQADSFFNLATSFISINSIETAGFHIIADTGGGFDLTGQTVNGGGELRGQGGAETITGTGAADTYRMFSGDDIVFAGNGNDQIYGGEGADTMNGDGGNDDFYVSGTEGLGDIYNGGTGTDRVYLQADTNFNGATTFSSISSIETGGFNIIALSGGGFDLTGQTVNGGGELRGQAGAETITGSNSADIIRGDDGADILAGGTGTDTIYGDDGDDVIDGGTENDTIYGGIGNDTIDGGAGTDFIYGGAGADIMDGGDNGDDFFIAGTDSLGDQYIGGAGTDEIYLTADSYFNLANVFNSIETIQSGGFIIFADVGTGFDLTGTTIAGGNDLRGQGGAETITGSNSADTIRGDAGNDILNGGIGADTIYGELGDDTINGGNDNDEIYGGAGVDILNGDDGNDNFYVSGTDALGDIYNGGAGTDELFLLADTYFNMAMSFVQMEDIETGGFIIFADTGTGFDLTGLTVSGGSDLRGQGGAETITGSDSADTIRGDVGGDTLSGGAGNDFLYGGADNDFLYGGSGLDEYYGEGGADRFVFEAASAFLNIDRLRDFSIAENDAIDISDLLTGYTAGVDDLTLFVEIVNSGGNSLLRVDSAGTGTFTQIATIFGVTGLTDEVALEGSGHLITA